MKFKKGQKVIVDHSRTGLWKGIVKKGFDDQKEEWYPIIADERVEGLNTYWLKGEEPPCRASLCKIAIRGEQK